MTDANVDILEKKLESTEKSYTVDEKSLNTRIKEHASKIDRRKTFQLRIIQAKQNSKPPVKQDVLRIRQYKKDSEKLVNLQDALAEKSTTIQNMKRKKCYS